MRSRRRSVLKDAHHAADQWYGTHRYGTLEVLTHMKHVTNLLRHYWPEASDEVAAGVLLALVPEYTSPTERLARNVLYRFGEETSDIMWELHRALTFTTQPLSVPALYVYAKKLAQCDTWTLRGLAAYITVTIPHTPYLTVARDTLLAVAAEDLQQILTAHPDA